MSKGQEIADMKSKGKQLSKHHSSLFRHAILKPDMVETELRFLSGPGVFLPEPQDAPYLWGRNQFRYKDMGDLVPGGEVVRCP